MDREIISRKEARERGLKRYFTGKPCKWGHVEERKVSNGNCVECGRGQVRKWSEANREARREYQRNRYKDNREARLEYQRNYYKDNREARLECLRKWREVNREARLKRKRKYRKENPEVLATARAHYRARKLKATCPTANRAAINALIAERRHLSEFLGVQLHLDHYVPLTKGGKDHEDNLWFLPASVNLSKGNKMPGEEWELPPPVFE